MQRGNTMRCDFSMGNTSMKFIAGAVLLSLASAASAGTIVGGGATLPAIGYTGSSTVTPITPGTGSLFGVYVANHSGTALTYCPTGSGAGKKILAGNVTGNGVNDACPAGFGGTDPSQVQADFAGSDAPMSTTEYNAYVNSPIHGGTQPTQLPAIAGAIGVVFKKTGVNSLTLTEDQICGIFSGAITDWSSISTASGPINVVYRLDGSGTSFSFLNHLSAVCPGVPTNATQFKTLQAYATGASTYIPLYASALPTGGVSGNSNVITAVAGTLSGAPADGSIGYAEVANGVTGGVKIASVTNLANKTVNPVTGFGPTAVPVTLTFDKAIGDTLDGAGRPILVNLPASSNGCIALVDPASYANLAPAGSGSTNYPIIAITNLLGNTQGNGTDVATIRGVLGSPYDTTIRSSVTKIGRAGTGYAWLSDSVTTDLTQARVDACLVN